MPPDLNSLPPSPSPQPPPPVSTSDATASSDQAPPPNPSSSSPETQPELEPPSPTPHSRPPQSAASASTPPRNGHALEHRMSGMMRSLTLNRSSTAHVSSDPQRSHPSLGQLHQELENEQEAQVNRLLQMIRAQQDELARLYQQRGQDLALPQPPSLSSPSSPTTTMTMTTTTTTTTTSVPAEQRSDLPLPLPTSPHISSGSALAAMVTPSSRPSDRRTSLSRPTSSRFSVPGATASNGPEPGLPSPSSVLPPLITGHSRSGSELTDERPSSSLPGDSAAVRDDSVFYQAETQTLARENQMLKQRIRELEKQISDLADPASTNTAATTVQDPAGTHSVANWGDT